jgi:hypothetical protein
MMANGHSADGIASSALRKVWRDPTVRQRIVEYLGGRSLKEATCSFIGSLHAENPAVFRRHEPDKLDQMLDAGCELARSLEDQASMLIHLDIEYVNFDDPSAAYLDVERIFRLQEPLVETIEAWLLSFGIRYLHLVTGQGHHFVWRIAKDSAVANAMGNLDIISPPDSATPSAEPLFTHLALLMEHFAQLVKRDAAPLCEVPVEITALHVGRCDGRPREMLSIDISEYGDPLGSRMIRIPYTVYRKPWLSGLIGRLGLENEVDEFFTLPMHEMGLAQLLLDRRCPDEIIRLARRAGVGIPIQEQGTERLMEHYLRSPLCAFHRDFYAEPQSVPGSRRQGGQSGFAAHMPPCVRHVLDEPNDWLLKPAGMQLVTRCLLASGWHPRHIAGLVRAKFCDPAYHWGDCWRDYDPAMRAEFYVRLFAGQITTGLDGGIDFNCVSQQEKQFCWNPCGCSLEPFRAGLRERFTPNPPPP